MPVAPVMSTLWCSATQRQVASWRTGAVELAAGRVVDVLEAGLAEPELGLAQKADQALVLAPQLLGLDQQAEALVEAERGDLRLACFAPPRPRACHAAAAR